jgi:hypothetical protein
MVSKASVVADRRAAIVRHGSGANLSQVKMHRLDRQSVPKAVLRHKPEIKPVICKGRLLKAPS